MQCTYISVGALEPRGSIDNIKEIATDSLIEIWHGAYRTDTLSKYTRAGFYQFWYFLKYLLSIYLSVTLKHSISRHLDTCVREVSRSPTFLRTRRECVSPAEPVPM